MSILIAVGMQWGDEGKGRAVDLLSENADIVARYNGGDNAGHTVTVGNHIFKLHIIPSGIIHEHTIGVLGNGMVINPNTLQEELGQLLEGGIQVNPARLWISDLAHLITPAHRILDRAQDAARGKGSIGTTGRGIGPAYVDKASRHGLRVGDLLDAEVFSKKLLLHLEAANRSLQHLGQSPEIDVDSTAREYMDTALKMVPFIRHIGPEIHSALNRGERLLAEGAQGTLLDLDLGGYPFVTSSCTTSAGLFSGLGIGLQPVERVIGITKAFQTRVGSGPFPTELDGDLASALRGSGANPWDEYGTTTGRPRRVGWLDLVLLRYAVMVNGATELFLTKMDILSGFDKIKVCTTYQFQNQKIDTLDQPGISTRLDQCKPGYESLPGWNDDLRMLRKWKDLPLQAVGYIRRIEDTCGIPVTAISVGPERNAVIWKE